MEYLPGGPACQVHCCLLPSASCHRGNILAEWEGWCVIPAYAAVTHRLLQSAKVLRFWFLFSSVGGTRDFTG